ncbi:alpha/beta-hydrolase [Polychaeton citri CBS 116435]|uniref:Acyl-protein thioesterase 1 n=1 Tax=Polychaeton citri CBS 116435 TaxID=1314669 RepID=A0A9P4QCP8_9PEZI|nr:alpha/beta-hydrolase [Polychaeton citri CBS 116435]
MTLPTSPGREDPIYKPAVAPPSDPAHGAAFIFVHGLGDTAEGLEGIADQFQKNSKLNYMNWILPNASEDHDSMTTAWYQPTRLTPFPPPRPELEDEEDEQGMRKSVAYIESLLDACVNKGIPPQRIVLGGFSQGCVVSLLTDLTSSKYSGKLAGIVGLMGYMPLVERIQDMRAESGLPPVIGDVPMFLARGQRDQLVPKRYWSQMLDKLRELGLDESSLVATEYQGGHGLSAPVLRDLCAWLERVVPDLGD